MVVSRHFGKRGYFPARVEDEKKKKAHAEGNTTQNAGGGLEKKLRNNRRACEEEQEGGNGRRRHRCKLRRNSATKNGEHNRRDIGEGEEVEDAHAHPR
jgi:hypothetical protein